MKSIDVELYMVRNTLQFSHLHNIKDNKHLVHHQYYTYYVDATRIHLFAREVTYF